MFGFWSKINIPSHFGRNKNHINSFITNLKAEMGRRRRQMSNIFGYKEGHTPTYKGKKLDYENNSSSEPLMRLKHGVFESKVTQESDGVLTILDVNQSPCPPMLIRPRPKSPEVLVIILNRQSMILTITHTNIMFLLLWVFFGILQ